MVVILINANSQMSTRFLSNYSGNHVRLVTSSIIRPRAGIRNSRKKSTEKSRPRDARGNIYLQNAPTHYESQRARSFSLWHVERVLNAQVRAREFSETREERMGLFYAAKRARDDPFLAN